MKKLFPETADIFEDWTQLVEKPLVTVRCNSFNQVDYITDALEGILMQRIQFHIEVLIHDDDSRDGTAEIIRRYQAENPGLIRVVFQTENRYSQGIKSSWLMTKLTRGKYTAYFEGDDYWTDPFKLQKHFEFLIADPDFSLCAHDVNIIEENKNHLRKDSGTHCKRLLCNPFSDNNFFD